MLALNDHVLVAWPQDADDDPASFLGKIVAARLRGRRTDLPFAVTSLFAGHLNPYAFFTTRGAAVAFQRFSGVAATEEVSRLHYVLVDVAPPPARMRVAQ